MSTIKFGNFLQILNIRVGFLKNTASKFENSQILTILFSSDSWNFGCVIVRGILRSSVSIYAQTEAK